MFKNIFRKFVKFCGRVKSSKSPWVNFAKLSCGTRRSWVSHSTPKNIEVAIILSFCILYIFWDYFTKRLLSIPFNISEARIVMITINCQIFFSFFFPGICSVPSQNKPPSGGKRRFRIKWWFPILETILSHSNSRSNCFLFYVLCLLYCLMPTWGRQDDFKNRFFAMMLKIVTNPI